MSTYDAICLIANAFRTYCIYCMMTSFYSERRVGRKMELGAYCGYDILISVSYFFINIPIITLTTNLLALYLLTGCYKGRVGKRLLTVFSIMVILVAIETIVLVFFEGMRYSIWEKGNVDLVVTVISTQIINFMFAIVLKHYRKKDDVKLEWQYWVCLIGIPAYTIYEIIIIYSDMELRKSFVILTMILVLLINFMVFYLYEQLKVAMDEKYEKKFMEEQLKIMDETNKHIQSLQHDMKNHLMIVQALIQKRKQSELEEYMQHILKSNGMKKETLKTGNLSIDNVINYKTGIAEEKGISTEIDIQIPRDLSMELFTWVTILGNVLDNAIEAATKTEKNPYIRICMRYAKGNLMIVISNSYNGIIREEDGMLLTTKNDKKEVHGIGLGNVRKALEGLGDMELQHTDKKFIVKINAKVSKKEEKQELNSVK